MSEENPVARSPEEKAKAFFAKNDASLLAAATPLPGAAGEAFTSGPILCGKWTVRKIVAGDWITFQKIGSALISVAAELDKPEEERRDLWDDQTDCELVWILSHTREEVRAAMQPGVEVFKKRCAAETADILDAFEYQQLCQAVVEQLRRAQSTAQKYSTKEGDGEQAAFFQDTKDSLQTAAAG